MCRILDQNSKVSALGSSSLTYDHPTRLEDLRHGWNKNSQRSIGVEHYIDRLVYNHQLTGKCFFDICNFIYLVREPSHALSHVMANGYSPEAAADYYAFRLRRMCEMAVKTKPNKSVLLSYDQLVDSSTRCKKFKEIEEMLNLKTPLIPQFMPRTNDQGSLKEGRIIKYAEELDDQAPQRIIDQSKLVYQKYLTFLADNLRY